MLVSVATFCFVLSFASGQKAFKPFSVQELEKYKFANAAEKSKVHVAAPQVPKDELGKIEELCIKRTDVDYFRDPTNVKFRCDVVYRCERPGRGFEPVEGISGIRVVRVQCPSGLHFDIERQTCDWRNRVHNCDTVARPELAKPNFNTEKPVCPTGQLQCGDGQCLEQRVFCDGNIDCQDGSDENACSLEEDPNAAPLCDLKKCKLPECFCTERHHDEFVVNPFDGKLSIDQVPQMILISFNGAVNVDNFKIYEEIFNDKTAINPNNCSAKGTFFVSHKYTNYSAAQELHRRGHEIATFSITSKEDASYWTKLSWEDWFDEITGGRNIIEKFADIKDASVIGMRAPLLQTGANVQFNMLHESIFTYDASITVPLSKIPMWPYSLHFRVPHKCSGNGGKCPTRSFPIWEMPINELDRRENIALDDDLSGCALVSSCGNLNTVKQFNHFLENNFRRHYTTSKAPFSLALDASWLAQNRGFVNVLKNWMSSLLKKYTDVYFVTHAQAIHWIQSPVSVEDLNDFDPWKSPVCRSEGIPECFLPNICPLKTEALPGEVNRLHTCVDCPKHYPWLGDPSGEGQKISK